jgi:uncharacterized membrane protein YuzA (DUF378 family)
MDNATKLLGAAEQLANYAFLWSEARLVIAAIALVMGGPPVLLFFPFAPIYGLLVLLVKLAWIVSGVASLYLLYRWAGASWYVFDKANRGDVSAFVVMIVSGINLGITGIIQVNPGLSFFPAYVFSLIGAGAYAWAAYRLYVKWQGSGRRVFL